MTASREGGGRGSGDSAGVADWKEEKCSLQQAGLLGCLPPSAGLSDPRKRTPAPRGVSFAPSCLTRHRCSQPSKHREPKFPFENLYLCKTTLQFPDPQPLLSQFWRLGGTPSARAPGAGKSRAGQRGTSYLLMVWFQRLLGAAISLVQAGRNEEPFAGSGLTRPCASCAPVRVRSQLPACFLP